MSYELSVMTGGLVFEVTPELDQDRIEALLAPALSRQGHPIERITEIGGAGLQICCAGLLLWLNAETRPYRQPRMRINLQPIDSVIEKTGGSRNRETDEHIKAVLAGVLGHLALGLGARAVDWLGKDIVIPAGDFIRAALPVIPRRVHSKGGTRPRRQPQATPSAAMSRPTGLPVIPRRVTPRPARTPRPAGFSAGSGQRAAAAPA